jgi:multidrug efflux system membrane fusion protein
MRATFDNPNGVLFPQQFVNVRLLVDTMIGVALAPNAAVQVGPSGNFVYLLNADSTVSKRDIVTGPADSHHTTISKGLAAGDKVVIDGVDRLRDGAKVTIAETASASGTEGQDAAAPRHFGGANGGAGGDGQEHRHRHGQGDPGGGAGGSAAPGGPPAQGAAAQ